MKKIDYDAYLKTIDNLATNQKDIIKKYLEEQCEKDEALKALYRPSHIDGCYNFIMECVRKSSTGGNAVVEDAVVFKMARDYFIEILPKYADDAPEVKVAEVEKVKETVADVAGQIEEDAGEEERPNVDDLDIKFVEDNSTIQEGAEQEPVEEKIEINKLELSEKQFAEIKQALEAGKTIEIKQNGEWVEWKNPCHFEGDKEYRIKPTTEIPAEPEQKDEVQYDENGNGMLFSF